MSDHVDFYVYMYFRPSGIPCYVGKGRRGRWLAHLKRSNNPHLTAIIKKAGGSVPHLKLFENLTNQQAILIEVALISAIGRRVHGGSLVNMTDGGDGGTGRPSPHFSEDALKRLREARLGKKASEETRKKNQERALANGSRPPSRKGLPSPNRGITVSKEQRAKISASLILFNSTKK